VFQISIENYLSSVLKGDKPSSSVDELAQTIESIGGYMIQQSEQIEDRLRKAASRLGELEEDFEQIIEAIALAEPEAPAPAAPAPSIGGSSPAMPSAPNLGGSAPVSAAPAPPNIGGAPGASDLQSALAGLKAPDVKPSSPSPGPSMGGPMSQMAELKNALSGGGDQSHLAAAPPKREGPTSMGGGGPMSQMAELKSALSGGGDQSHLPAAPPRRDAGEGESSAPQSMQSEIMGVLSRRRDRKEEEVESDPEEESSGIYKSPVKGLSQQPSYKSILKPIGSSYEEVEEVGTTAEPVVEKSEKAAKIASPAKKKMAGTTTNIAELAAKRFSQLLSGKKLQADESDAEAREEGEEVVIDKEEEMEVIQKKVAEVKDAFSAAFTKGMNAQKGKKPVAKPATKKAEPEVKAEKPKVEPKKEEPKKVKPKKEEVKPAKKAPAKKAPAKKAPAKKAPAKKKAKPKKGKSKVDLQSRLKGAFSDKKD